MDSTFAQAYCQTFSFLGYELGEADAVARPRLEAAARRLGIRLPAALREFYLVAGGCDQFNRAHNRLFSPEDWWLDAGKLVFLEENQAVVWWGIEVTAEESNDPPVFQGVNLDPQSVEWHPEQNRCSEFLTVMLYWQAVCGGLGYGGMAGITPAVTAHFETNWQFIGQDRELRAYGRTGQAACIIGEGDYLQLFVGGSKQQIFEAMTDEFRLIGIEFDEP